MKIAPRSAVVLFALPLLVFGSCVGDPPAPPRTPVVPIGSTPPARPSGPVATNPNPGSVPPATGGAGGTGGAPVRPSDARRPDSPGSDTPPAALCTMTVVSMGMDRLIDDFNDNTPAVRAVDGRAGTWETRNSATAMITNQPMPGVPELPTINAANGRGLRVRGMAPDPADTYGAEVQVTFSNDPGFCYDATTSRGVQLQIRGLVGTRVFLQLLTAPVRALNAATPASPVGGHYRFPITVNNAMTLQTVMVLWDQFEPGWGTTPGPKVDPKQIYGLAIVTAPRPAANDAGTGGNIGAFDFTIDNVQFIAP
jgi:hypothetical protein